MIERTLPEITYDIEMERLGGGEVIHNFANEEDSKSFVVARDYWNWTRLNTYTLSFGNGETTKASSTWRDFVSLPWSSITSLKIEDAKENPIGALTTGFFRPFPATITGCDGGVVASLNYSGDTWLVRSAKNGRAIATLEPKEPNSKGIKSWTFSVYNTTEIDPRLLGITAAFISHNYSQSSWPTYLLGKVLDAHSSVWSGLCTVASLGFGGVCDLTNWVFSKIEDAFGKIGDVALFVADEFGEPAAYNAAVLCAGLALVFLSVGLACGGIGFAKVLGATVPAVFSNIT